MEVQVAGKEHDIYKYIFIFLHSRLGNVHITTTVGILTQDLLFISAIHIEEWKHKMYITLFILKILTEI